MAKLYVLRKVQYPKLPPRSNIAVQTFVFQVITGHGGLHHITNGMGDFGVGVVPQTLHTIDQGISA